MHLVFTKLTSILVWSLVLFLIPSILFGQNVSKEKEANNAFSAGDYKTSLVIWKELAKDYAQQKNVKAEIKAFIEIVRAGMHIADYETSHAYALLACKKARNNNLVKEYGEALNTISIVYEFLDMKDSVIYVCQEILNIKGLRHSIYSDAYTSLASGFKDKGELEAEQLNLLKAIEIDRMHNDSSSLPYNLSYLGSLTSEKNKHHEALEYFFESMTYMREGKDDFKKPMLYTNISTLFNTLKNFQKSEEYGLKAYQLCVDLNLSFTKVSALNCLGNTAFDQKKYETALDYFLKSDSIYAKIKGRISFESKVKRRIGECRLALGQFEMTKIVINEIKNNLEAIEDNSEELAVAILDARYALKTESKNALDKIQYAEQSYLALHANEFKDGRIYNLYSQYYKSIGDYQSSLGYAEKANLMKDSIYRNEQSFIVHNLEGLYKKKEQESTIELLGAKNKLQTNKLKQQRIVIAFTVLGLALIGGLLSFIFSLLGKVRIQKEKVENSLGEKEVLLKEIHHRVKNNLQVISSLLALQSKYIEDDTAILALQQGQDRVYSMSLIHQFLYEGDNLIGVETSNYFEQLTDNLAYSYNVDEDVVIDLEVEALKLDVDTMIPLGLIVNELVSNAFKHAFTNNSEAPKIKIFLKEINDKLFLEVKDNGESLKDINSIEGKSFGFELIKAFAKKLHAQIEMKIDSGLSVKIYIDKYKAALAS